MKQSCFTEEQIMGMWKEGEAGVPVQVSSHGTAFVPWARRPGSKEKPTAQQRCRGYLRGGEAHGRGGERSAAVEESGRR